jgi:hypothetical protein
VHNFTRRFRRNAHLLAVLRTVNDADVRKLSFEQVADGLMEYEKRRWTA